MSEVLSKPPRPRRRVDFPTLLLKALHWIGMAGFVVVGARILWPEVKPQVACTTRVTERWSVPVQGRVVEVLEVACPRAAAHENTASVQVWVRGTAPGDAAERLLIALRPSATHPPRIRWGAARAELRIEGFLWDDILDWEHGRGGRLLPVRYRFLASPHPSARLLELP